MKDFLKPILPLFLFLSFAINPGWGQELDAMEVLDNKAALMRLIENARLQPLTSLGTYYYQDDWNPGGLKTNSGIHLTNIHVKWNLLTNNIEVRIGQDTYLIDDDQVAEFYFKDQKEYDHRFVNVKNTTFPNRPVSGFYEILVELETGLISLSQLGFAEAAYSIQLDAGRKEDKYQVRETFFLFQGFPSFQSQYW